MQILAWIIWLLIIGLCVFLFMKQRGFHPDMFEMTEGEEIIKQAKGDYWTDIFKSKADQNPGEFAFTNKRILFKGFSLIGSGKFISISYNEIVSVEKAFVVIWPVAFVVKTVGGEKFKFAIMKRDIYIDLINSFAKKDGQNE